MDDYQKDRMGAIYIVPIDESAVPDLSLLGKLEPWQRRQIAKRTAKSAYRSQIMWVLLRCVACKQLDLENHRLRVSTLENGKPFLAGDFGFHFSLSHTGGAVAAAVADRPVGVDIERVRAVHSELANRFFTPAEQAYIFEQEALQQRRFFAVWTRKEAFIKRTGVGLSTRLSSFDTLTGSQAGLLHTVQFAKHTLSVCYDPEPSGLYVQEIAQEHLLAAAGKLSDCN